MSMNKTDHQTSVREVRGTPAQKATPSLLLKLFFVTFRIGAFTFGGGYAMIPIMQEAFVDKYGWVEESDIVDIFAISQSLPGVIAVNVSMFIGTRIAGAIGGIVAAVGVVLPSLIVISILTLFYEAFITNVYVLGALRGIRAAVVALMASAVLRLRKQSIVDAKSLAVFLVAAVFAIFFSKQVSAIVLILGGVVAGLALNYRSFSGKNEGV